MFPSHVLAISGEPTDKYTQQNSDWLLEAANQLNKDQDIRLRAAL